MYVRGGPVIEWGAVVDVGVGSISTSFSMIFRRQMSPFQDEICPPPPLPPKHLYFCERYHHHPFTCVSMCT